MPRRQTTPPSDKDKMFVRLKPYDKGAGFTTRRLMIGNLRFFAGRWHIVKKSDIQKYGLEERHQKVNHPLSPLMFDIVTKKEAEELDGKEKRARENTPGTAAEAVDLSSGR